MRKSYTLSLLASLLVPGQSMDVSDHSMAARGYGRRMVASSLTTAAGGFGATCDEVYFDSPTLQANCETPPMGPPWICSQLNLNECLGNDDGTLIAKDG